MNRDELIQAIQIKQELERREDLRYPALRFARRYHLNTRGQPMDFVTRPYLLSMYKALPKPDLIPQRGMDVVIKKCVQMGISEWAICALLAYAGEYGKAILYVLPKFDLKYTFVSNRIDKPIKKVPYYMQLLSAVKGGAKTKGMKHFGEHGVIKVVGSNVETEFVEYPADVVVIDEADQCDQTKIPIARDRLKGPGSTRLHIKLGNPTIESGGLNVDFEKSNRMEWYVPCPKCGTAQEIKWFGNVCRAPRDAKPDEQDWGYWELIDSDWYPNCGRDIHCYCRSCGTEMDRTAPGQWYEENPGARTVGFHLSKLMDPTYSLEALYETFDAGRVNETKMMLFFQYDLGLAYSSSTMQLTRDMLNRVIGGHPEMEHVLSGSTVMGVDVGTMLHYWIEEMQVGDAPARVLHVDYCKKFETLDRLVQQFNVICCVVDARPESRLAMKFAKRWAHGRVWRCDYEYHGLKSPTKNWGERLLRADRTISMDSSHGRIAHGLVSLPKGFMTRHAGEVVRHMIAPARIREERPNGSEVYVWENNQKPDHWRHAQNYASIAQQVRSLPPSGIRA